MESQDSQEPRKSPKGYGKRPLWQWILIYIVVAVVVYGLIYLLFIKGGSTSGY
jgi:flagellar basal body-associated protein FliL